VATTDGGGVLDLLRDGEGAVIVPPSPPAFGAGLARCLADPTMRHRARLAGDRLRDVLSPEAVARAFERLYGDVTAA